MTRRRRWRRRARGRGFTLVEIMVAVLISAMLVGMILSIFSRMSLAFRTQENVAELQQTLAAAADVIDRETRQAGFGMPQGFFIAGDQALHPPVEIVDDADGFGPDLLEIYTGDGSATAFVTNFDGAANTAAPFASIDVDDPDNFTGGDLAVISQYDPGFKTTRACVVQLQRVVGQHFDLETSGTWATADNDQCDDLRANSGGRKSMVYRFRARAFRIDPARRDLAVLQVSPSGALVVDDWQDLGVGFTDLQLASRWYDRDDGVAGGADETDTADVDTDPTHEWYSGADEETFSAPLAGATPYTLTTYPTAARPLLTELRVSLAVRTHTRIDTVPTAKTPAFIDLAIPDNNDVGNRDSVQLDGVADASRPEELRGDHVYRYITFGSDLRNLAVGADQ